jgi:hypothetical protein
LTFILTMEILRSSHLELFDNGPGLGWISLHNSNNNEITDK